MCLCYFLTLVNKFGRIDQGFSNFLFCDPFKKIIFSTTRLMDNLDVNETSERPITRTVARKFSIGACAFLRRWLDILKIDKNSADI